MLHDRNTKRYSMKQSMTNITIYHNPKCSNSRGALALIREHGLEPEVIEYLKTPPSKETLKAMIAAAGITTRELLRAKEEVYAELGLDDAKWTDDELVDFIEYLLVFLS
jgi:Arsenate reductase and related proteins, glutaredoxin family